MVRISLPHQPSEIEIDSGSIKSIDSGIVTSPTSSHASQSPRESTAQSSLELINSNQSIERSQDSQNGNNKDDRKDEYRTSSECQPDRNQSRRTCSEMALAIYQR